ncbi:MAG TPA: FliH/SctL family protein [Terriglobales bacterium]|nr:FliH/SctL family protein [Terriglobales bacterium]
MSTSFNGPAASLSKDVTSFVYRDSAGHGQTTEPLPIAAAEPMQEKPHRAGTMPRISQEELTRLIADARAEGFRDGEKHARSTYESELARMHKQVADLVSAFQQERAQYFSKVEVELVHFALAIAARILHREAHVDRMVVAGLVKVMIDKLQQGTGVILRIRPEEADGWKSFFRENQNLEVVGDSSVEVGSCLLESDMGTADMGLDAQLKEVEKGFFDLLAQKPGS